MSVPFDREIWNAEQCADYLGQSYSTFIKRTQYLSGFPKRCPIPGQPRWRALDVTEFAINGSSGVESRSDHEREGASL